MFDGKLKALTFSYDDGVTQDIRMIKLFNKYGIKGTFNLNSNALGKVAQFEGGVNFTKNKPEDVKYIYDGHEVAVHTLDHPNLTEINDCNEIIRQVEQDRLNLSELVGYEVVGMAYPCGPINHDDRVAEIIKNNTGVKYARAYETSGSFEPYVDLYQYKGTIGDMERPVKDLFAMGEKFLNLKPTTPQVFYIWGHAFNYDWDSKTWDVLEDFLKMMSGKSDIFYGTNKEVLLGK